MARPCPSADPKCGGLLHSALRSGNIETIQFVLDKCSFDVKREDESCETSLLTAAASSGNATAMRLIYGRGAKKMNFGARTKSTLVAAASSGSAEAMKFSISHGSHIDETDEHGVSVCSAQPPPVGPLKQLNARTRFGAVFRDPSYCNLPPIFAAAVRNNVALMQFLLDEHHCTLDEWDDDDDTFLLKECAQGSTVDALRFTLERAKKPATEKQQSSDVLRGVNGRGSRCNEALLSVHFHKHSSHVA